MVSCFIVGYIAAIVVCVAVCVDNTGIDGCVVADDVVVGGVRCAVVTTITACCDYVYAVHCYDVVVVYTCVFVVVVVVLWLVFGSRVGTVYAAADCIADVRVDGVGV